MEFLLLNSCQMRIIWKFLEQIWLSFIDRALYMLGILYGLPQTVIIILIFYSYFMVKGTEAQMDNGHEMSAEARIWTQVCLKINVKALSMIHSVVGCIKATKDVHVLIPKTWDVILHHKRDFANVIKDFTMGDYPGLSRWAQSILKGLLRGQSQWRCDKRSRVRERLTMLRCWLLCWRKGPRTKEGGF